MIPVTYLNMYIVGILGFIGATMFGGYFFYQGMEATSFMVPSGSGMTTYYFDKNKYDLYFQGFVYCMTFLIAGLLLLSVMAIPSQQILQRNPAAMAPAGNFAAPQAPRAMAPQQPVAPPMQPMQPQQMQAPPMQPQQMQPPPPMGAPQQGAPQQAAPSANEIEDDFDDFDDMRDESRAEDSGDSDVIFGTSRVTEESTVDFIHKNPDSAIKFMYRKNLDGKPLQPNEEDIYQGWQNRGLSRGRVREYVLQIMEWESLPDKSLMDVWSELRDQIFELTH